MKRKKVVILIQHLTLADKRIIMTKFGDDNSLQIVANESYHSKLKCLQGLTKISFSNWSDFSMNILRSSKAFGEPQETELKANERQSFSEIQKIELVDDVIYLRGKSKDSDGLLTYKITGAEVTIDCEVHHTLK